MFVEVQQKLNENEEKLHLEKEKVVIIWWKRYEKNLQIKIGKDIVFKRMYPSVRKYSKGCKWWFSKSIKKEL